MDGTLKKVDDREKIKELWSPMIGAWFTGGPDDPEAVLLEFELKEAAMWASTSNPFRFGYEILKSNADESKTPDMGEHIVHNF